MATITQRGQLQWQAKIRRKGFPMQSKTFELKGDAEKWARKVEREMDAGTWRDNSASLSTTLGDALDRYGREVTPEKKGAAIERLRVDAWRRLPLAKSALGNIRGVDLAEYRDKRIAEGISGSTVRRELGLIGHLYNVARTEWGFEGLHNPLDDIKKPTEAAARDRVFYPGERELLLAELDTSPAHRMKNGAFSAQTRNAWLRPIVELALETAMRRGELLSLLWDNVDLERAVAHLPDTKNGDCRDVPLSSRAVGVLRNLPRSISGRVFPVSENATKLGFFRAVARARKKYEAESVKKGVEPDPRMLVDLHFHDLRHVATTHLASLLHNVMELSAVTGHKDLRMLKRYYHPKAEDLARKLG